MATRNIRPFVHLRVLSSYSLGLGLSTPWDVCRHARRVGFDAVALTDVSGTYGFVEFHRAAREAGVKPIYGTLVFLDWSGSAGAPEPVQSLLVLALDRGGLKNVCAIASASAIRRERGEGMFAHDLDGRTDGVIGITLVDPRHSGLTPRHLLAPLYEFFGDRLFLECRAGLTGVGAAAQIEALTAASELGFSSVLTQDVRFVGPARPQLMDLMASLDEPGFEHGVFSDRRAGDAMSGHGMLTASEMSQAYDEFPEAYTNAALIAALVQPDLFDALEDERDAPATIDMFAGDTRIEMLRSRVEAAFVRVAASWDGEARDTARARIVHELELIADAGLETAFLRFEHVLRLLRATGTRIGPATGLSLQSLCAYLLGITSFDPYAGDPRFEPAFEEPNRPGHVFDLQIAPEDRPGVLAIINRAFEGASVGYVPTVEHITAARALRIVARRMGAAAEDVEDAIRAATRSQGASLRELSEENRTIGALYRKSAVFRDLVAHAAAIEGLPFGFARTKRTVIVSARPLKSFFGYTVSPDTGEHFVQATRDAFPLGAVLRIDLATLNVLGTFAATAGYADPPDPNVYGLVGTRDLEGIHLLEGAPGRLASSFGIASFDDLVLFVAVLRHRGDGLTLAERLSAFRGEPRSVPAADRVGDVLAATRGWLLFDDQLRDVVAGLTGLPRADSVQMLSRLADHAPGNLATLRREFFARTVERSVSLEDATHWFTRLVRKSGRVVDRQRAIAECLLIHRCLAMKTEARIEFMARLLDHAGDEKRVRYRQALEAEGKWLVPRVGRSGRTHVVEGDRVRAPLWMVPGISREVADRLARLGPFAAAGEFARAAETAGIAREDIEALERAGAIDPPAEPVPAVPATPARRTATPAGPGQVDIPFRAGDRPGATAVATPPDSPAINQTILAPGRGRGNSRGGFVVLPTVSEFYPHPTSTPVELAGRIRNLQTFRSSSDKKVGYFELVDSTASARIFVPAESFSRFEAALGDGRFVIVRGKVRQRDGRKVLDALEVTEGGSERGETSSDEPTTGDP